MDFAKEGLLDGLKGSERQARIQLLTRLVEMGVTADELKQAAAEGRLPLLPVERMFAEKQKYSARRVAELAGIDLDFLLALRRASGLPLDDPDAVRLGDADLDTARSMGRFIALGLPESGLVDVARIFGELTARTAAATRDFVAETFIGDGDSVDEHALAIRLAEAARELRPLTVSLIEYLYLLHMREQVRNEAVTGAQLEAGNVPGLQEVSVGFADLVGFTWLGESIPPEELGGLAGRLATMIADLIAPPVTLTKMVGDAGMLVCDDTDALLDAALQLVDAAEAQGDDFPPLKVGIARGEAIHKWGDWYGSPVNLADRVTSIARPSSVLVTSDVREAAKSDYKWSRAGERKLKGVQRPVTLFRVRRGD